YFFFSSRRRHTRCYRDWSSDVCSSDLTLLQIAESIADSTFIRAHIEGKYNFDFDAPLNLQQRAQAWAFERMIEHHVYWALVGARWVDAENFAKGPTHFFDGAPEHLRERLREDAQFRVAENYL